VASPLGHELLPASDYLASTTEGKRSQDSVTKDMSLAQFVENVYYPFYTRKWKLSTTESNINRVNAHLVSVFGNRKLAEFRRDDLQSFLDGKSAA
jgi:hypothetical protein